jgi:DeoR family transcriptional regulator, aga operon transcriptional repressor
VEPEVLPARVRRERMLALLRDRDFVRVGDLAHRFDVSEVTVRSDLDALAGRGLLRRVRGGAVPRAASPVERPFEEAEVAFAAQKRAIGQAAATMVTSGDTVVLDVGTTTTAVAQALAAREDLAEVVTGGTLRPKQHSLVEPLAGFVLRSIHAGTAFLGCNGVEVAAGITNVNLPETEIKRMMVAATARRVVCADSSKLGQVALAHVCPLDDIDVLLTDRDADPQLVAELRETGLDVRLVPTEAASIP